MGKCGCCGSDQAQVKCAKCKSVFYCDKNCQKKDWKLHKKDCQEPLVEPLDAVDVSNLDLKVEVRKKPNGKYGVFATVALKEGERLCYYDGVTKDANTKIRMRKLPDGKLSVVDADQVFADLAQADEGVKCLAHPSRPGFVKIASDNKEQFGIGQWICDYTEPYLASIASFDFAVEEIRKYQDESTAKSNCQVNDSFWFTASQDIESGSELFVHYGFQFWMRQFMLQEKEDLKRRFFYYALHDQTTQVLNLRQVLDYDDDTCTSFLRQLILMPQETLDKYPNVKDLMIELTTDILK